MATTAPHNDIVFFHYTFSPIAKRVVWYLALRGIDYAQCMQPPVLPRPDLASLGVRHRRIPIIAIGRDIYVDSRLQLSMLESRFPNSPLRASSADQAAIERLLEKWTMDDVFLKAAQLIPPEMPLLNDPKFVTDREDYTGRSWAKENVTKMRPEALAHVRDAFELLETGLLADGREWILKTEKPSLADIEAVWPFHWLTVLKGALPPALISGKHYPKTIGWINRFDQAIRKAQASTRQPATLKGADAVKHVMQANFAVPEGQVDESDPLGLKRGQIVDIWPSDTGVRHRDQGRLIALTMEEVVIATQSKVGGKEIRIHFPRLNFRIQATGSDESKL